MFSHCNLFSRFPEKRSHGQHDIRVAHHREDACVQTIINDSQIRLLPSGIYNAHSALGSTVFPASSVACCNELRGDQSSDTRSRKQRTEVERLHDGEGEKAAIDRLTGSPSVYVCV